MRRFLACLVLIILGSLPPRAEEAKPFLPEKASYRVLVVGDSLAGGLWSGFARMAEGDFRLSVDGRYKEESGLARPEIHDWAQALPKSLAANPADIVVVMIGSNDAQSIRDGALRHAFGTPEWVAAYEARIDALTGHLKDRGIAQYWVSPPAMQTPKYDAAMKQIGALQKTRVEAAGGRWIDIRTGLAGPGGDYAERGADETGADRRLRAKDGIHFLKQGNNRLGLILLAAIRADMETSGATAAVGSAETVSEEGPLFGQDAASGAQNIIAAAPLKRGPTAAAASVSTGPVVYQPGTAAEQLFLKGLAPPPPKGRLDDFSAAPAP